MSTGAVTSFASLGPIDGILNLKLPTGSSAVFRRAAPNLDAPGEIGHFTFGMVDYQEPRDHMLLRILEEADARDLDVFLVRTRLGACLAGGVPSPRPLPATAFLEVLDGPVNAGAQADERQREQDAEQPGGHAASRGRLLM